MARSRWRRYAQYTAAALIVFIGAYAIGAAVAGPLFWYSCSLKGLDVHGPAQASVLYYRDGTELGTLGAMSSRTPVTRRHISPVMQQAMMAIYQDGTYRQILTAWNLLDGEIPASQIIVSSSPTTS